MQEEDLCKGVCACFLLSSSMQCVNNDYNYKMHNY